MMVCPGSATDLSSAIKHGPKVLRFRSIWHLGGMEGVGAIGQTQLCPQLLSPEPSLKVLLFTLTSFLEIGEGV